ATTTTTLMRHERRANAERGVSSCGVMMVAMEIRSVGSAPGERNVLARLAAAVPFETVSVSAVHFRSSPCGDRVRTNFGAGWVQRLDALTRQRRGTGEGLGLRFDFAGDRRAPRRKITGHLEFDWHEVDATHF